MTLVAHGRVVLDGFTLDVDVTVAAETVAVVGDNGTGKTTLLRLVAGLLGLRSGRLALGEIAWDEPGAGVFVRADRRGCGMLFQDALLLPHLDVVDNVAFPLRRAGVSRDDARRRARDELARVGIESLAGRDPGRLSGGEAQRVALARALVRPPSVLLLDEPFASLDRSTRAEFRLVLAERFAALPGPRLLVTHDDADVAALCAGEITVATEAAGRSVAARAAGPERVVEYVGVYDADHTLRGEAAYWFGARLGVRHCGLCDVTHGTFRPRADWARAAATLDAPFVAFHRDDAPDDVRAAAAGAYPLVLVRTTSGVRRLLDAAAIDACQGSPEALVAAIRRAC